MGTLSLVGHKGHIYNQGASSTTGFRIASGAAADGWDTTEAQAAFGTGGTFSKMACQVVTNDRGASTARFRVNAADGNQTFSVGASATGWFEDTTNSDTISDGDSASYQMVTGAGGTTFCISQWRVLYAPSSGTIVVYQAFASETLTSTGVVVYPLMAGYAGIGEGTVARVSWSPEVAGMLRRLSVYVTSNTRSETLTWQSCLNGAAGNLAASLPAGTSGTYSDLSNSDSVGASDLLSYRLDCTGGTGNLIAHPRVEYVVTSGDTYALAGRGSTAIAAGATNYFSFGGQRIAMTTESDAQASLGMAATLANLRCYVRANSLTAASTYKSRVAGADGNLSVSIGSGATGWFSDTTNSDSVSADQQVAFALVAGGSGTSITLYAVTVKVTPDTGPSALSVNLSPENAESLTPGVLVRAA